MIIEDIKLCIGCKSRLYETTEGAYYCKTCGTFKKFFYRAHDRTEDTNTLGLLYKMAYIRGVGNLQHRIIEEFSQFIDDVIQSKRPELKKYEFEWNESNAIEKWIEQFYKYCTTDCRSCFEPFKEYTSKDDD